VSPLSREDGKKWAKKTNIGGMVLGKWGGKMFGHWHGREGGTKRKEMFGTGKRRRKVLIWVSDGRGEGERGRQ